jgi:adenylate cyclase
MNQELRVLLIEDSADDAELLLRTLRREGFGLSSVRVDTPEGLATALSQSSWDVIISDYSMPKFSGLEALRIVREHRIDLPFILVSGSVGEDRAVEAMRAGAHDYIMKSALARLAPAIRREVEEFRLRRKQIETDRALKETTDNLKRLRRFFSPQVAELLISHEMEDPFKWHRKEISVVFIDLRGFTSFVETEEPEVVVQAVQEYYAEVGRVVQAFGGTIGHVAGDGVMIFLNDPIDVPDHQSRALDMALELRRLLGDLQDKWREQEHLLDFGAGLATGYASIGGLGSDGCWDYSVIGTVTNLASRLCSEASSGQILISHRLMSAIGEKFESECVGDRDLKGLHRPMRVYNVLRKKV